MGIIMQYAALQKVRAIRAFVKAKRCLSKAEESLLRRTVALQMSARRILANEKGQGTTEYAILVGVIVVIAILAITVFRPKLEELWQAITTGINSL